MKVELAALVSLKSKLTKPCKKLIFRIFRFRIRKPFSIKSLIWRPLRQRRTKLIEEKPRRYSLFRFLRKTKNMDRVRELRSVSDGGVGFHDIKEKLLFPSPITPAYVRARKEAVAEMEVEVEVEDACRSFENYLVEMMIEEGKVRDLMDVEELLYCWKNLKCPVFVDLVSRFYGELCKDLFAPDYDDSTPNLQPPSRRRN